MSLFWVFFDFSAVNTFKNLWKHIEIDFCLKINLFLYVFYP